MDEPSSSGVHDGLAGSLAEGIVKVGTVVLSQVITDKRLATVLVDTLEDLTERDCESPARKSPGIHFTHLVTSGISETREERGELAANGSSGVLLEDDLVEDFGRGDLQLSVSR